VAATSDGFGLCLGISGFVEPSTRAGRRFAKPAEGAEVVGVDLVSGKETLIAATRAGRALLCSVNEVSYLSGSGKGVLLVKLDEGDALVGFLAARSEADTLLMETSLGGQQKISTGKYERSSRGGKGREVIKRGNLLRQVFSVPPAPPPLEGNGA
jgi:DNA gyrase subunit A